MSFFDNLVVCFTRTEPVSQREREEACLDVFGDLLMFFSLILFILLSICAVVCITLGIIQSLNQGLNKVKMHHLPQRSGVAVLVDEYWHNEPNKPTTRPLIGQVYRYESGAISPLTPIETTGDRSLFPGVDGYRCGRATRENLPSNVVTNEAATSPKPPLGRTREPGYPIPFGAPHAEQVHRNPIDVIDIQLNALANTPQSGGDFWQSAGSKLLLNRFGLPYGKENKADGCGGHNARRNNFGDSPIVHVTSLLWRHRSVRAQEAA